MTENFDLEIRNGTIVDGSGGDSYRADLEIRGRTFAKIGDIAQTGFEEIDAAGCVVAPGFVDVRTHYDGQIAWENALAPSSDHGITTAIMGDSGVGIAPCRLVIGIARFGCSKA